MHWFPENAGAAMYGVKARQTIMGRARPRQVARRRLPRKAVKALLGCGIAYPVGYAVANDVIAASRYDGYSRMNQAVSELSATGAPTRRFLTATVPVFAALEVAYGVGSGTPPRVAVPYAPPARCCSRPASPR